MDTSSSTLPAMRPVIHLTVSTFLFFFAYVLTVPFMVDVMLGAICSGQIECSQVILMLSAQQVVRIQLSDFTSTHLVYDYYCFSYEYVI